MRAGRLSRFHTAKERFFTEVGPGLLSMPAINKSILKTKITNGKLLIVERIFLVRREIPDGNEKAEKKINEISAREKPTQGERNPRPRRVRKRKGNKIATIEQKVKSSKILWIGDRTKEK